MNKIGTPQNVSPESDEIDISALFNELALNKGLILLITLITLTIGSLYAYIKAPQYESDVLLQVESGGPGFGRGGFVEKLALGGSGGGNAASAQTALIQSRYILEPVIQALHLDIEVKKKGASIWGSLFPQEQNTNKAVELDSLEVPVSQLNKRYSLRIDKPGYVSLFDSNGRLVLQGAQGKQLSNKNNTVRLTVAAINSPSGSEFVVIKRPTATVMKRLMKRLSVQESGGKGLQAGTGILSVKLTGNDPEQIVTILDKIALTAKEKDAKKKGHEASQTLNFLSRQLPITKEELENAEANLNEYRSNSGKIDFKLQTRALITQFSEVDKTISKLRMEKVNLQQQYTLEHPRLLALDRQLKSLRIQRHELERTLKKLPASDQVAVNLLRDVTVTKTLYMVLLSKIQELQVLKAGTLSSLRILAMAKTPEEPLPSHIPLILLISAILGVILSTLVIFARRMLSATIDDPHWGERHFNLPTTAIIPFSKEQNNAPGIMDKNTQLPLLAYTTPKSGSIESLRSLRTSLQISLAGASNNIVSILGISPGVGKSFIAANTAYLLASAGKKVLLIDADLRRGTLHKYMNVPPSPGLAEVLNGSVSIEQALSSTMQSNLSCLPRGMYPEEPSELLMHPQFKNILEQCSKLYDAVIIDTPPVLLVTDALIVAGLAGTNYLLLGAATHQEDEVELALKRLLNAGVHLHGSIFNYSRAHLKKALASKYGADQYAHYYDEAMSSK